MGEPRERTELVGNTAMISELPSGDSRVLRLTRRHLLARRVRLARRIKHLYPGQSWASCWADAHMIQLYAGQILRDIKALDRQALVEEWAA